MANEGNWVTINGVHVLIGANGKITKGPAKFVGSTVNDLKGQKMTSDKKAELKEKYGKSKSSKSTNGDSKPTKKGTSSTAKANTSAKAKSGYSPSTTKKYRDESTTVAGNSGLSKDSVVQAVRNNINSSLKMAKAMGSLNSTTSSKITKMQDYFESAAIAASKRGAKVSGSSSSPFTGEFTIEFSDGKVAKFEIPEMNVFKNKK